MRQAIITRFLPPTNHRGARIVCSAQRGRVYHSWDHELDVDTNHIYAAHKTAVAWDWLPDGYRMVGGGTPAGTGYAFVIFRDGER